MRRKRIVLSTLVAVGIAGCRAGVPVDTATTGTTARSERTVFTDSAMHTRLCQPAKPGEDWRRVCTPLDQSVTPVKRLPP